MGEWYHKPRCATRRGAGQVVAGVCPAVGRSGKHELSDAARDMQCTGNKAIAA